MTSWEETDEIMFTVTSRPANDVTNVVLTLGVSYENFKQEGRRSPIYINQSKYITFRYSVIDNFFASECKKKHLKGLFRFTVLFYELLLFFIVFLSNL